MEKGTVHCPLPRVRQLIATGRVRSTFTALRGAAGLGLDYPSMIDVVRRRSPREFYKSMTTYADHRQWHDVYRTRVDGTLVYIKLCVVDDVVVVSFKER